MRLEQTARLRDKVVDVGRGVLLQDLDRPRLRSEHGGERRPVEFLARRLAAAGVRLDENPQPLLLGDADPGLHQADGGDLAPVQSLDALRHRAGVDRLEVLRREEPFHHLERREVGTVERRDGNQLVLEHLGLVDARIRPNGDGERGHRGAEGHDLPRPQALALGLHGSLHDAPFAHAVLVDAALVVDRVQGTLEDGVPGDGVGRGHLRHARRGNELDVQPLVLVEALVARHQHGQVVDSVHHRKLNALARRLLRSHGSFSPCPMICLSSDCVAPSARHLRERSGALCATPSECTLSARPVKCARSGLTP